MRKRFKLVTISLAVAIALTVGLTATTFAWGASGGGEEGGVCPADTFVSKVAGILELEEEQVAEAFEQARGEIRQEIIEKRLQKAVENGLLTEEEAGGILEWLQDRPEALEGLKDRVLDFKRKMWQHRQQMGERFCRPGPARILDAHVAGTITAVSEEENAITLVTEDGDEVTFQYTSNTVFNLRGVIAIEEGQVAKAGCWEDVDGNLTAKFVHVGLPWDEAEGIE